VGSNKRLLLLLLLLGEQGLLLLLVLRLLLRLEVRRHRDGRQRWSRAPWPHLDGAGPGVVEARPRAPPSGLLLLLSSSLLLLVVAGRSLGTLS